MTRIVKHRDSYPPCECYRCGYTYYGIIPSDIYKTGHRLCRACWTTLDTLITTQTRFKLTTLDKEEWQETCDIALQFTEKKQPCAEAKRFHKSVPKWMRSAILAGLMETNNEHLYRIYSQGESIVNVERIEKKIKA